MTCVVVRAEVRRLGCAARSTLVLILSIGRRRNWDSVSGSSIVVVVVVVVSDCCSFSSSSCCCHCINNLVCFSCCIFWLFKRFSLNCELSAKNMIEGITYSVIEALIEIFIPICIAGLPLYVPIRFGRLRLIHVDKVAISERVFRVHVPLRERFGFVRYFLEIELNKELFGEATARVSNDI